MKFKVGDYVSWVEYPEHGTSRILKISGTIEGILYKCRFDKFPRYASKTDCHYLPQYSLKFDNSALVKEKLGIKCI